MLKDIIARSALEFTHYSLTRSGLTYNDYIYTTYYNACTCNNTLVEIISVSRNHYKIHELLSCILDS